MGEGKKSRTINVSEELSTLYTTQKTRLNALFQKEVNGKVIVKEITENIAVTMKMLELIHSVQSEKNVEDAIEGKNKAIDVMIGGMDSESDSDSEEEEEDDEDK